MLLLLLLGWEASAHSWLGCSDYRGPTNYYDASKCLAFPRYWEDKRGGSLTPSTNGYELGADTGYNYQPGAPCNLPMASGNWKNAYTTKYPYAVYEQGKVYCLAWPTKNHAAASCTNQYIPDTKMTIYRTGQNPTSDPTDQATFTANTVTHNFGVHANAVIDCLGYQRAPRFCENTDRALATGCIQIPADLPLGNYVFQWYWIFNPGSPYTTCWDAEIVAPGSANSRGSGGLLGYPNITDNLGAGGSTCSTKWLEADQAAGMTIPDVSQAGTPGPVPTGVPSTPGTPPPTSAPTTDMVTFAVNPAQIPVAQNATFTVKLSYFATARRSIVVDILNSNSNPPVWFGKGQTYVTTTTATSKLDLQITLYKAIPADSGYLLRAWIVNDTIYDRFVACTSASPPSDCTTTDEQPWTEELDRADFPVVASTNAYDAEGTDCGDKKYTAGEIAATFFGTLIGTALIFVVLYFVLIRPKLAGK